MPQPTANRVGATLQGRYRLLSLLGEGAMGSVYLAERVGLARRVAVKFLRAELASDPTFAQRFEVETRALGRLSHPNCVLVFDFGVDRAPYLVMELVEGESLRDLLRRGPIELPRALAIAQQLLAALAHAHGKGVVHRDVKPENLMLEAALGVPGDHLRVLDFGLSRLVDDASAAAEGLMIGTPSYMAPEQLAPGPVDQRTDVYAAGLVLYEMLTGRNPFAAATLEQTFLAQRQMPPPPPATVNPALRLSPELTQLLERALAKSPERRFASALEMQAALAQVSELAPVLELDALDAVAEESPLVERAWARGVVAATALARVHRAAWARAMVAGRSTLAGVGARIRGAERARALSARGRGASLAAAAWLRGPGRALARRGVLAAQAAMVATGSRLRPLAARARVGLGQAGRAARQGLGALLRALTSALRSPRQMRRLGVGALVAFTVGFAGVLAFTLPARSGRPAAVAAERAAPVTVQPTSTESPAPPVPPVPADPAERIGAPAATARGRAELAVAMAEEAFAERRFADGLATFRIAIRRNAEVRANPILIKHVIEGLASDRLAASAESFLRELGPAARSPLREAASQHAHPRVRKRAQALLSPPPPRQASRYFRWFGRS